MNRWGITDFHARGGYAREQLAKEVGPDVPNFAGPRAMMALILYALHFLGDSDAGGCSVHDNYALRARRMYERLTGAEFESAE